MPFHHILSQLKKIIIGSTSNKMYYLIAHVTDTLVGKEFMSLIQINVNYMCLNIY